MSSSTLTGFAVEACAPDERVVSNSVTWQIAWVFSWLAPNAILRVLAEHIYHPVGYVNLDLLLLGALALFLPPGWAAIFMVSALGADVLEGVARTWYFGPLDLAEASQFLGALPAIRIVSYAALLLTVFGGTAFLAWVVRRRTSPQFRRATCAALLLIACVVPAVDVALGGRGLKGRDTMPRCLIARVPEMSLYRQWGRPGAPGSAWDGEAHAMDAASAHALVLLPGLAAGTKPDVVEIVIESWGQDRNGVIDQNLEAVYQRPEITQRYQIITGTVPFHGPTVAAEMRELCHSSLGFGVLRIRSSAPLSGCLPAQFIKDGYQTEAIHGYIGGMFERYRWYRLLGFEHTWFENGLHGQGLTDCPGPFPGICDEQIARWIGNRLAHNAEPVFEYWMTLNSHLPVPSDVAGLNPVSCDFDPQVRTKEASCAWFKLEYQVHSSIANLAARRDLPPTMFIVVGDHAPPFIDPALHNRFSTEQVPYLILVPRQTGGQTFHPVVRTSVEDER